MAKSIKSANRQGRPKRDEDDEDDDDDDDDYKSRKDDDYNTDDNKDDDNNNDGNDDDDNNISELAIGKGSNTKRIKKKIGGEYNNDMNFVHGKDWEKKYLWGLLKFKPYYNAKVYSECMKDTISVMNNIKIKE